MITDEFIEDLKKTATPEEVVELERFQRSRDLSAQAFADAENPRVFADLGAFDDALQKMAEAVRNKFDDTGKEVK